MTKPDITKRDAKIVAANNNNAKIISSSESIRNTTINVLFREIERLDKATLTRALSWDETKKLAALTQQLNATQREQREEEKFYNPDNLSPSEQKELVKESAKELYDNMTPKEKASFIEWLKS